MLAGLMLNKAGLIWLSHQDWAKIQRSYFEKQNIRLKYTSMCSTFFVDHDGGGNSGPNTTGSEKKSS